MANINKDKKYHFIYKTTNILTGKYYVGIHSTSNLKDGYLGSGKRLRYNIRKYGEENFKIEILEYFSTRESLVDREKEIVNENLLRDPMCMNLKLGGVGGCTDEVQKIRSFAGSKQLQIKLQDRIFYDTWKSKVSEGVKRSYKEGRVGHKFGGFNKGDKHKQETIEKMKGHDRQIGEKNSQYGKKWLWINNGIKNSKIEKNKPIPNGWNRGILKNRPNEKIHNSPRNQNR